jgi:hypothetical protein
MEGAQSFTFVLLAEIGVRATHTVDFQAHLRAHLRQLYTLEHYWSPCKLNRSCSSKMLYQDCRWDVWKEYIDFF